MAVYGLILKVTNQTTNRLLLDDIFPSGIPEWQKQKLVGGTAGFPTYLGASATIELPFTDFVALSYSSGKIRALITAGTITTSFKSSSDYVKQSKFVPVGPHAVAANATTIASVVMPSSGTLQGIKMSLVTKTAFAGTGVLTIHNMTGDVNVLGAANYNVLAVGATQLTEATAVTIPLTATAADLVVAAGDIIKITFVSNNAGLDIAGLGCEIQYSLGS